MEISKDKKRLGAIVLAILAAVLGIAIIFQLWKYALVAAICFGFGYYYGRKVRKKKS